MLFPELTAVKYTLPKQGNIFLLEYFLTNLVLMLFLMQSLDYMWFECTIVLQAVSPSRKADVSCIYILLNLLQIKSWLLAYLFLMFFVWFILTSDMTNNVCFALKKLGHRGGFFWLLFWCLTKLCNAYIYPISSPRCDMTATNKFLRYSSDTGLHNKT